MFPAFFYGQITPIFAQQIEDSKQFFSETTEFSFSDAIESNPVNKFIFLQDKNIFRDNAMTVFSTIKFIDDFENFTTGQVDYISEEFNNIENNYIQIVKSDKDPIQMFFILGSDKIIRPANPRIRPANPHFWHSFGRAAASTIFKSSIESINFIFNNDKSTLIKFNSNEIYLNFENKEDPEKGRLCFGVNADIKSLLSSLKKYSKADIKVDYKRQITGSSLESAYATMNLSGSTNAINKIQGIYQPTSKNSGYIYKMGLVNSNPFDLEKYVDKFILDAKLNHGIDFSYVNKNERLIIFRQLEGETIALAYEMNNDKKVLILVDPENWKNANQSLRYYIIYHELGHDILNLEHGEGGRMMNPYKEGQFSWSRFETDKTEMFSKYKLRDNKNGFKSSEPKIKSYSLDVNPQNTSSIIIGSFGSKSNAENLKKSLINEGFDNIDISKVGNVYRVSVLVSGSKEKVQQVHKRVKVNHKSAWISYN